jgi:hypothetical protein
MQGRLGSLEFDAKQHFKMKPTFGRTPEVAIVQQGLAGPPNLLIIAGEIPAQLDHVVTARVAIIWRLIRPYVINCRSVIGGLFFFSTLACIYSVLQKLV